MFDKQKTASAQRVSDERIQKIEYERRSTCYALVNFDSLIPRGKENERVVTSSLWGKKGLITQLDSTSKRRRRNKIPVPSHHHQRLIRD